GLQVVDRLPAARRIQVLLDRLGPLRADAFHAGQAVERGVAQGVDIAELPGDQLGHRLADVADAEAGEHARQPAALAGGDAVQQVLRGQVAHAFQLDDLVGGQPIEVGDGANQVAVDELVNNLLTQAGDVHGAAGGVGAELPLEPAGTVGARAAEE